MFRNAEHQKVCYRADCKAAWKKNLISSHFLGSSGRSNYRGTRPVRSPLENPIKHEGFEADKHGRPWKVVAGQISANAFHCATIPDGPACKWEDGALERTEAKNRGALKSFADAAEIGAAVFYADLDWQEVISPDGVKCFVCAETAQRQGARKENSNRRRTRLTVVA